MKLVAPVLALLVLPTVAFAQSTALSAADRTLLQRLVLAEAGGEGELGMALVARATLNRLALVQSREVTPGTYMARGRTLRQLIYAPNQYEPVSNGSLDRRRSAEAMAGADRAIDLALDTAALRARLADEGLSRAAIDRLLGATGFRTPSAYRDSSQSYGRQRFGGHVFNGDRFSAREDVPGLFEEQFGPSGASRPGSGAAPGGPSRGAAGLLEAALSGEPVAAVSTGAGAGSAGSGTSEARAIEPHHGSAEHAHAAESLAAHVASGKNLRFGDSGEAVEELQRRIGAPPTGVFNSATELALMDWQRAHGVEPTGEVGPTTLAKLDEVAPARRMLPDLGPLTRRVSRRGPLEFGDRGPAVEELQRRIGVQPTGLFGPTTADALERWQRDHGVAPTREVGRTTLAKLDEVAPDLDVSSSRYDAYRAGRNLGPVSVARVDGKPVEVGTARAFLRMRAAALQDGVAIRVVSGFRSHAEQTDLYRRYRAGTGNLAARPGYSNHQSGAALDLNTSDPDVYRWLQRRAGEFGFVRTVPSEAWHWELRG